MSSEFNTNALYVPSAWQAEVHGLTHDIVLGAGAAGPGKTFCLLWDPILNGALIEHYRCVGRAPPDWDPSLRALIESNPLQPGESVGYALYVRREMPRLRQVIDRSHRLFKKLDPSADWNEKLTRWTFSSGFRYQFGHCSDERDTDNYLSNEYSHLCIDEAVELSEGQYEMLTTRVRTTDPVMRYFKRIRLATNPSAGRGGGPKKNRGGHDRGWVKRVFVDPAPEGRKTLVQRVRTSVGIREVTRVYVPATLYDNPDKDFVREYELSLMSKPAHIRRVYLEGDWNAVEGSYYGESWNSSAHVCEPFRIPSDWPKWRSMDWGFRSPGCIHWFAFRPDDKRIFVFFEMTFREKGADWVAGEMVRPFEQRNHMWSPDYGSRITGPADTQLWELRGDSPVTKAALMAEQGVTWSQADKRSRADNARALYERLVDHENWTRTPGIVFFRNCTKVIETIPIVEADTGNPEELSKSTNDHWVESVQYGVRHGEQYLGEANSSKLVETDPERLKAQNWQYW